MNEQPPKRPEQLPEQEEQFYQPSAPPQIGQPSQYAGYGFDDTQADYAQPTSIAEARISWTASEYVHHAKGTLWLLGFIAVVVILLALAIWSQAWTFAALVVVMGVALGIIAFRKPHELHYTLSDQGLQIDEKFYAFDEFRAFGIVRDGALFSIMLLPVRRLAPVVNVYFEEKDGEKIVDILGMFLPMERLELDLFDRLMRQLRF